MKGKLLGVTVLVLCCLLVSSQGRGGFGGIYVDEDVAPHDEYRAKRDAINNRLAKLLLFDRAKKADETVQN